MKVTIDRVGRLVVPKALREELGLEAGTELDISAVDGRLEVAVPSRVRVERGEHGAHFAADDAAPLSAEDVRRLMERARR